jgi:hypothetical protein
MLHVHDYSLVEYDSTTGIFTIIFGQREGETFDLGVVSEMPRMAKGTNKKTDTVVSFFTPNTAVFKDFELVFFQMGN